MRVMQFVNPMQCLKLMFIIIIIIVISDTVYFQAIVPALIIVTKENKTQQPYQGIGVMTL